MTQNKPKELDLYELSYLKDDLVQVMSDTRDIDVTDEDYASAIIEALIDLGHIKRQEKRR